ncbi:Microsomal triacylglycerol transfer protein [Pseudolycoriella hygida]|uniref:Microsomal triacylglycerol transfer protein n=1 Tax=Pseudolycoriella hygida TaxID=35572 RepID=A0A9Q0S7Q1_9DIPT|nr:Microsomal triacylglycerol transfer protein [Pseudolycoriella hygida]
MKAVQNFLFIAVIITYFAEPVTNAFPIGSERSYAVLNDVTINHKNDGKNIGYRINGVLKVGAIWGTDEEKLLKFHLISPKLQFKSEKSSNYVDQPSPLDAVTNLEFYAIWHLGKITKSFFSKKEDASVVNLKKGLISLFQYQLLDGRYTEDDVSGRCDVVYRSKSTNHYEKMKTNCQSDDLNFHSRDTTAIGVSVVSWRMSDFVVTQDGTLDKIESREYHEIVVNAFRSAGGGLESVISLKFDGSISNIPTIKETTISAAIKSIKGIKSQPLSSLVDGQSGPKPLNVKELVKKLKDDLTDEKVGKYGNALAISKLVQAARVASKEEFVKILKSRTMKDNRGQLLDLLAATQTVDSHEAAKEIIQFTSAEYQTDAERYLQSLGIGTRPKNVVIEDLLQLAKKNFDEPKVMDTLIQTIASMGCRYARLPDQSYESEVVRNIEAYLLSSLDACKEPLCKVKYIRGLQNLQSPNVKTVLWAGVYDDDRVVTVASMKALRNYPKGFWSENDKNDFLRVFYQQIRKFDSSARTLALDVLLEQNPSTSEIKELLHFLRSNDKAFEVKQYLLQNLALKSDLCPQFRERFTEALVNEPLLYNYHIMGQKGIQISFTKCMKITNYSFGKGLSTALSGQFSTAPSFNGTFFSSQEVHGGVLKRGVVDVVVNAHNDQFRLFTVELYTAGLSSFVSSSDDDNNSDETATAGMEITVQGSYLRPLEFFNGQGDLMGHVWSGTASEPTPAYTAATLLHDHEQTLRLQNGASLHINVLGTLSLDLNGQIQISLWNRNAHCQVNKNTGVALIGSISSDTSFVSLNMNFTITEEPKMQILTEIDFSSDVKLCMQVIQPEAVIRNDITKVQQTPRYSIRRKMNFTHRLLGCSHLLNQKNNDMCRSSLL